MQKNNHEEYADVDMIREFEKLPTTIISDSMNKMNSMSYDLKPLISNIHVAGRAFTVQSMSGGNYGSHMALYQARIGDILVIDARGDKNTSVWGGIQTYVAIKKGIKAVVINGTIRDVQEIRKYRFPMFCLGATPNGPHKGWKDNINVPISCAGVSVNPGDIIVGDDDGVVVVPKQNAKDVLEKAKSKLKLEEEWIKRIDQGIPLYKILNLK